MAAAATWARPRLRLLWTAGVVGLVLGGVGVLAGSLAGVAPRTLSTNGFSLGTLVFGVGVLGWSGSALAGRGIETMRTYLDTPTNWTERDSRRAMTRLVGFGAGVMLGVAAAATALGAA